MKQQPTYYQGERAAYTGAHQFLHGAEFHELRLLTGRFKGATRLTVEAPERAAHLRHLRALALVADYRAGRRA